MTDVNANQFPELYAQMDINVNKLGVVMLDTVPIDVRSFVPESFAEDLHWTSQPERHWIRGDVASKSAHVTLLYGLLQLKGYRDFARKVLEGWKPEPVEIQKLGVFHSPFSDEPYSCIVAHVKPTANLLEGHARLELLPHINTFTVYRPHLTLAYIEAGREKDWLRELGNSLMGLKFPIANLNYGGDRS